MTTGSRSRTLGRLGASGDAGNGAADGRLGSLGDVQPAGGGGGAADAAGPSSQQQPPPRRLTPAERFKPKPQPRTTRRASTEVRVGGV
jgi:hypothetical protein